MTLVLTAKTYTVPRSHNVRLEVYQSTFSDTAKHALQRVGSPAVWDKVKWCWSYPLTPAAIEALDKAAKVLGAEVAWEDGLREHATKHLAQAQYEHETRLMLEKILRDPASTLPPYPCLTQLWDGRLCAPMRHQQIAYHWSQRMEGLLLAHQPGLGKTRSATDASAGWYRNGLIRSMAPIYNDGLPGVEGGVLIVCPKTMLKTWENELAQWQNLRGIQVKGTSVRKRQCAQTPAYFHIINYEGLAYVAHSKYDGLIIDEVHRASNHTKQTEHLIALSRHAKRKVGLSGTPLANNLESIFYPMLILDGGRSLGASKTAFLESYFVEEKGFNGFSDHKAKDGALERISSAVARSCYWLNKEEALDLPEKTFTPVYLEMTTEQERYYQQIKKEAVTYIQDGQVSVEQASARMMKLLQICQGFALADDGNGRHFTDAKTEALMDLLTDTLKHRKVIVWAYFNHEIARLTAALKDKGIKHVRIDGTITSQRERDRAVERWNTEDGLTVFIRQLNMSEGVTLLGTENNPCFNSIYMGVSYRYVDWLQSQDRIHRIGQRWPVSYSVLLTENGIDRAVYEKVLSKVKTAADFGESSKGFYLSLLEEGK